MRPRIFVAALIGLALASCGDPPASAPESEATPDGDEPFAWLQATPEADDQTISLLYAAAECFELGRVDSALKDNEVELSLFLRQTRAPSECGPVVRRATRHRLSEPTRGRPIVDGEPAAMEQYLRERGRWPGAGHDPPEGSGP